MRALADATIDRPGLAAGLLPGGGRSHALGRALSQRLLGHATLQDLPAAPRFIITATNPASGSLVRFTRAYLADWRVGKLPDPDLRLADAVAASCATPPWLAPYRLKLDAKRWETTGNVLADDACRHADRRAHP